MASANHSTGPTPLQAVMRFAATGMIVNAGLAGLKIGAGILGNATALIADGVESLLDIAGSIIIWSGLRYAAKPADNEHPYGHGKAEPMAAAMASLGVMVIACGLATQSIKEILHPGPMPKPFTLVVLLVVIALKEAMAQRALLLSRRTKSTAIAVEAWHHRSDAITSVAAFIGIGIALLGGPGWEVADDWAALAACGFIFFNGIRMCKPAIAELLDTAPSPELEKAIRSEAMRVPGVEALDKCRIRKMGLDIYVDLHVRVAETLSVRRGHDIAHRVKDALRESNSMIADVLVHIEPQETPSSCTVGL